MSLPRDISSRIGNGEDETEVVGRGVNENCFLGKQAPHVDADAVRHPVLVYVRRLHEVFRRFHDVVSLFSSMSHATAH